MNKQLDLKSLLQSKMGSMDITPIEVNQKAIEKAEMSIPHNLMFDAESTEFKPETKYITTYESTGKTVEEAKQFNDEMNRFIDTVLIAGSDFGLITNCKKPTLLKSGAEKILNYLGLIARTEVVNRVENYDIGFFSYEIKVFLIDYNGVVKAEGLGICNSRETKYAKSSAYQQQNTIIKMAKKRALVDATLNVGSLSSRFTQDIEDLSIEPDVSVKAEKPITQKQIQYLEKLMRDNNISSGAINKYCIKNWNIDNYTKITGSMASSLIEKFKTLEQQ